MAEAGRVIAGSAKGIRLVAPGEGTRPLSDRVKQTLFAILEPDLSGARVLDLFAGSGAGGIEALSRGAASADFVERDGGAARVIAQNLARAHVEDRGHVHLRDVAAYLRDAVATSTATAPGATQPYDVVLVDPPYADTPAMSATLEALADNDATLLTPDCWVVAKHFWRTAPPQAVGLLASIRSRRFGETALTFYRLPAAESSAEAEPEEEA